MSPQTAEEPKKASSKKAVACDNHPDRDAVLVTDGKAFQELHLCQACVPPGWDKDDQMYVSRCVFLDGVEVFRGPDCPHGRTQDEMGEIIDPGWTVQQGDPRGPNDRG